MKRILLVLLVVTGYRQALAEGNLAYLDSTYGFRDLKFEQRIGNCPGMQLVDDGGDTKTYKRSQDKLKLGDASLANIRYYFYKGQFSMVAFTSIGEDNYHAVLQILQEAYGRYLPNSGRPLFFWNGERVTISCKAIRKSDPNTGDSYVETTVAIFSKPLDEREKADKGADEKAKARQGTKDL